jgi:cystathionine beta-lyase/cystathionine gamma-synthase
MVFTPKELSEIINSYREERDLYLIAVAPPLIKRSIFPFKTAAELWKSLKKENEIAFYTLGVNPATDTLRKKLAALEHTGDSLIFASGSAAIVTSVMVNLRHGDQLVCVDKPCSWTKKVPDSLLSCEYDPVLYRA